MSSTVNLQTVGIYTEPNPLTIPEGALTDASNVVIQRDNVIEPRRGFGLFGTSFGSISDRLKQLFVYKFRLFRHWGNTLEFDTGTVNNAGNEQFDAFNASVVEAQTGLRIKSTESNGNFYFTSSQGIRKISAATANDFTTDSGYVTLSGGIKALDLTATPIITQGNITGFLPEDSATAYRAVWGTKDLNNNLILGVPSQRAEVFNSLTGLLIVDNNNTLGGIQDTANLNTSLINQTDYVSTLALLDTATPELIQENLISLADKLDNDILIATDTGSAPLTISAVSIQNNSSAPDSNVCTVTFSAGTPTDYWSAGSHIYLTGFPKGENGSSINGAQTGTEQATNIQTITSATSSTITFLTGATGNSQVFGPSNVDITNNKILLTNNGFKNFDPVKFTNSGGALPTPLVAGTVYYLGNVNANDFQVFSDAALSTIVTITAAGTGTNTVTYFMPVTGTSINSGEFRFLLQPQLPSTPATNQQLLDLQTYLKLIISTLQAFPTTGSTPIIAATAKTNFILPLTTTTSANVKLIITIPQSVTPSYFLQLYRAPFIQAVGTTALSDLTPSDELQLVYEAFPTAAELSAGVMTVIDSTPDSFLGADLYTNEATGVGIANANEDPPFALDINKFKNTVFLANTRTKYRMSLSLLGVSKLVADYLAGTTPKLVISDGITTNTYSFVLGVQQVTRVTTVADVAGSLAGKYFLINSANNINLYYIWYNVSGAGTDPMVAGRTGIEVFISTGDTANTVATKTRDTINSLLPIDFNSTGTTSPILITNTGEGYTNNATAGTSGFTVTTTVSGVGENASAKQVLLSNLTSPAQAVDETARSLVHVINLNTSETLYAFYLSQGSTIPGQMTLESRLLTTPKYYLFTNNANTGSSFNPNLNPVASTITISTITSGGPLVAIVTTSTPHGLQTGDQVMISATNSTPSIDGLHVITYISATSFSIPITITISGTTGQMIAAVNAFGGDNEKRINRIYFSRLQQPESFPLPNTLDVGDQDKAILRILPIRDSLFVFKEDGLFRISGEVAPFQLQLFDPSCVLIAPDSLSVAKNVIYGWTTQGILSITEAGVSNPPVSRPIDISILPITNNTYPNFSTATWGIGYESDNSYIVYTVKNTNDTEATIAYRYSTLTASWTTFAKTNTCGIVNITDDKLYLGAGDINFIEQERKNFNRFDYADRELFSALDANNYQGNVLRLPSVKQFAIGDVVIQDQDVTVYEFNALLQKLDLDLGLQSNLISSITTGSTPTITTIGNHFLVTGDFISLTNTQTTPNINGTYQVTVLNSTQFQISVSSLILTAGTVGLVKYSYYNTLKVKAGDNLNNDLLVLATRLDTEPNLVNTYLTGIQPKSGTISNISIADPTIVTSAAHGMVSNRYIEINSSNSVPTINGNFTATILSANIFSIPVKVLTIGTTGNWSTLDGTFQDTLANYNYIISLLNSDIGTEFKNYMPIINTTSQETIIIDIDYITNKITVQYNLDFVIGPLSIFKAIPSSFTYAPVSFKDTLSLKQVSEATLMFENKAFTNATLSFKSDLLPRFIDIPFLGNGNGSFGLGIGKFGGNFFGGGANAAPFRTYIPRDVQRCRYIIPKFTHNTALEKYIINGLSLTGNIGQSTRAYR